MCSGLLVSCGCLDRNIVVDLWIQIDGHAIFLYGKFRFDQVLTLIGFTCKFSYIVIAIHQCPTAIIDFSIAKPDTCGFCQFGFVCELLSIAILIQSIGIFTMCNSCSVYHTVFIRNNDMGLPSCLIFDKERDICHRLSIIINLGEIQVGTDNRILGGKAILIDLGVAIIQGYCIPFLLDLRKEDTVC